MVEIYISNNVFMHIIYAQLEVCSYFYLITVLYIILYFLQMKTDSMLMT